MFVPAAARTARGARPASLRLSSTDRRHRRLHAASVRTDADFAPLFKAELFEPNAWASLFQRSGAKYVVLTSKVRRNWRGPRARATRSPLTVRRTRQHHEGWCNFRTNYAWQWNAIDSGPHRDLVADLSASVRAAGLHMGLYHSLFEWYHPLYVRDRNNKFNTSAYVDEVLLPMMRDLITQYQPHVLWSDGDWEAPDTYWKSPQFLAWLYNESPVRDVIVSNDRWGSGISCHHGGFYTCEDRYNPGKAIGHKWENAMTIDRYSWGFRRNANISDYLSAQEIIVQLVSTVSCGGNLLLNVGPGHDGTIAPIFQERLLQVGDWLRVNGDAIYRTTTWRQQNDTAANVWYTARGTDVFAIALSWPKHDQLVLTVPVPQRSSGTCLLLGFPRPLPWAANSGGRGVTVDLSSAAFDGVPGAYGWAVHFRGDIA